MIMTNSNNKFTIASTSMSPYSEWPEAWLMPETDDIDLSAPNQMEPNVPATVDDLINMFRMSYYSIADTKAFDVPLSCSECSRTDRQRKNSPEPDLDYANVIALHADQLQIFSNCNQHHTGMRRMMPGPNEICYVLTGTGFLDLCCAKSESINDFFDDETTRWVRLHVMKGDLIMFSGDVHHRFTATSSPSCSPLADATENNEHESNDKNIEYFAGQPFLRPLVRILLEEDSSQVNISRGFSESKLMDIDYVAKKAARRMTIN